MITMEISEEFCDYSNDQIIIKGKRTKRPRPISSSTSSTGVCLFSAGGCRGEELYNSISISSPSSSTGLSSTTEEEDREIAANCLILLARGGSSSRVEEEIKSSEKKTGSRRFTEMPLTTNGKVGMYAYECRTCSRAFPSFQALGGHRASHKKPKPTDDTTDRKTSPPINQEKVECGSKITVTPAQLPHRLAHHENRVTAKIHECSICSSEFGSGQALGGHMRRHRAAVSTNNNNFKSIGISIDAETSSHGESEKAPNMLALDLNMQPESDRSEETFH